MEHNDKQSLVEMMEGAAMIYGKGDSEGKLPMPLHKVYFESLKQYSIDQVSGAISAHCVDPNCGQFFPKPADIVRKIEGTATTTDEVISGARLAKTPFGCLCLIQIGSYDLKHQTDMFYLKQRAQECLDLLPEWKEKAQTGGYTDHEISIMLKHEVNPSQPFNKGLQAPPENQLLKARAKEIFNTDKHQALIAPPFEEQDGDKALVAADNVKKFLEGILND